MVTVTEAVTFLNVVTGLTAPVAHLAVVLSPCMNSTIVNGDPGLASLSPSEVRGRIVVVVNVMIDAGNGVSGGKAVQALVHGKAFGLKGLFESSNAAGNLDRLGVVGAEVLDFSQEGGIVLFGQGPIYKVSILSAFLKEQLVFGGNGGMVVPNGSGMEGTGMDSAATTIGGKKFWECGIKVVGNERGNNVLIAIGNDKEMTGASGCEIVLPTRAWEYAGLRTTGTGGLPFGISIHSFHV